MMLNAIAVGILLFLVWDVLSAAWEPIDAALGDFHAGNGGLGERVRLRRSCSPAGSRSGCSRSSRTSAGWTASRTADATLVDDDRVRRVRRRSTGRRRRDAMALAPPARGLATWSPARQLALLIAVGIGLHNFAEGLAIGQAAANSEIALATLLVIGFALHNATEGFGIVAPLAGEIDADGTRAHPELGVPARCSARSAAARRSSARRSATRSRPRRCRSCSSRSRPVRSSTS